MGISIIIRVANRSHADIVDDNPIDLQRVPKNEKHILPPSFNS